jgi:hypothetical protein
MPMPANQTHVITLRLLDGHVMPESIPQDMSVGDTVTFSSPDGPAMVEFPNDSPFVDASGQVLRKIPSSQATKLQKEGQFDLRCTLTLGDKTVGWKAGTDEQSGAQMPVRH